MNGHYQAINKYAPKIMAVVGKCINSNSIESRRQSLTTIASVAQRCKNNFSNYLDGAMKLLESALKSTDGLYVKDNDNNNDDDNKDRQEKQLTQVSIDELEANVALREQATSCLGNVAFSVGYKLYEPYFNKFYDMVMNRLNEIDDSALRESTFTYFSEIAQLKGNDITKTETFADMLISVFWIRMMMVQMMDLVVN